LSATLIVLGTLLSSNVSQAQSTVEYKTYPVRGSTIHELFNSISKLSPIGSTALTETSAGTINWHYTRTDDGKYQFDSLNVNQRITITLPEWTDSSHARSCVVEQWNSMMSALIQHEEHHKNIFLTLEPRVTELARLTPPQETGEQLFSVIESIWLRVSKQIREEQQRYDADTSHGQSEGVILKEC